MDLNMKLDMSQIKEKLLGVSDKKTLIKFGIGLGSIILFLIIYYAILNPMVNDRKAKFEDKLKKQSEISQFESDIVTLKAYLKKTTPEFEKSSTLFHSKAEVEGLYNSLSRFAGANGHLELNVFKPLFAHNIIESSKLLGDECLSFSKKCIDGLEANKKKIKKFLNDSLMLVTALNSKIGYYKAAEIANKAYSEDITLKEACLKLKYLSENEFNKIVDPKKMI